MRGLSNWRSLFVVVLITALLAAVLAASPTVAAEIPAAPDLALLVNTDVDGVGDCSEGATCSLRAAIDAANGSAPGVTTIEVPAGTYVLSQGPLVVTADDTYIFGAFSPASVNPSLIDADGGRGFEINADGVTLAGLAITNGDAGNQDGGAVLVKRGAVDFLLSQSTVSDNNAKNGAGLLVTGSARVEQSTFARNTASSKGAGIRVNGSGNLELVNSTFSLNDAQSGGAVSVAGVANISYSTFVDNTSNNSSGAGVDRNGGSVTVTGSIMTQSNQQDATGSDCSGSPDLIGVNFVGNAQGCNPGPGTVVSDSTDPTTVLVLGDDLGPNGGPTETIALLEGSLGAIDRGLCTAVSGATITDDQRDLARPATECDLGAYEIVPLSIDISLSADATEVGVGVVNVPVENILPELLGRNVPGTGIGPEDTALNSIALNSIALNSIALNSIALNSIDIDFLALNSIALNSIALNSIALNSIALNSIALNSIALNSIPLTLPGGWEAFLVGTPFEGFPIQTVTLENLQDSGVSVEGIGIGDIDLSSTALNSIALQSILLADTALNSIALNSIAAGSNAEAWCIFLGPELCDRTDSAQVAALGELTLLSLEFVEGVPPIPVFDIPLSVALNSIALNSIALNSIDISNTALNSIALNSIALNSIALNSIALNSIALNSIALNSIALNSIDISNTALNSIALNSIALNSIDINCTAVDCTTATLGEAVAAGAIDPATPLGVLLGAIDPAALAGVPLGDTFAAIDPLVLATLSIGDLLDVLAPGDLAGLTLGDLLLLIDPTVLSDFSLADLLLAFLEPADVPFETIDLDSALLQNVADPLQPEFHYIATLDVIGGPADIDVTLNLPTGFAFATNPLVGSPATFAGQPVSPVNDNLSMLEFSLSAVPAGSHQLVVAARAGLTTGTFPAFVTAAGTAGDQSDSAGPADVSVSVVEAFDDDGPGSIPPVLGIDGELQLAHVSRSDDVDLYEFTVPPTGFEGTSARILLSNIPDDVDYDLTVFAPLLSPLRGASRQDLSSIGDIGFDLDPTDDIYSTDVVQDIPLTTPQDWLGVEAAVRGVSSRRSNADEEVKTATLVPGATYYVQVTSYNGDLSDKPYALRVRLSEGSALPACAVGERPFPHNLPAAATQPALPQGVNTLFVTNTQWLEATLGPDDANVNTSEADDVLAAIDAINGVAGVVSALVPVDAYGPVRAAYTTWRNDRCDVDDRNAVVTAIGAVLDGITDVHPGIENIVIVGDDGVVPMAGIPDLTTIAPEASFAPEVVTPNAGGTYSSNELSAALGAGLLLSDDPYGTDAGILVGDHELFIPDRNLGRLVETGDQIVTSLNHFVEYEGQLDPETLASAVVSGYDFLEDGANDVKAALLADGLNVNGALLPATNEDLIGDTWDRDDLLAGFKTPGLDVISPNAHYDYETLLPALQNATGTWDTEDLVSVADVTRIIVPDAINSPDRATVVFTMGCHAGLSVSDVQLGFSATDWAETYATGNNLLIAQSTYGYGDSDVVALSERLITIFAGNLSEMTVGEAARFAKAEYLATTLVLNPYDEKILQSLTNYGLPMYEMGDGSPALAALAAETPAAEPADLGPTVDGITPVSVDLTVGGGSGPSNLNLVTVADEGSYYEVGGDVVAVQHRPVEPLVDVELPAGINARGFLITELTSLDVEPPFDPLYFRPSIDLAGREPRIFPADSSFPATLQRVTTFDTPGGERQRLLLAAGQFQAGLENDGFVSQDVQRLFTHIAGDLYSEGGDPTDTDGPLFSRANGQVSEQDAENVAQFEVSVEDAVRCYILFRVPLAQTWTGVPLNQVGTSSTWLGAAPVPGGTEQVEFFTQCVDDNGNVSISDNKVDNYLAAEVVEFGSLDIALFSSAGAQNGYFRGDVVATVNGLPSAEGYTIEYSIDSQLPFIEGTVDGTTLTIIPAVRVPVVT